MPVRSTERAGWGRDIGGYGSERKRKKGTLLRGPQGELLRDSKGELLRSEGDSTLLRGFGFPPEGVPTSILKGAETAVKETPSKSEEKKKIRKRKVTSSTTLTSPLGLTGAPPVVRPTLLGG